MQPNSSAPQIARARSVANWASLRTISALMLREMSTRYGRTPGGYIWGIIEPLAAILILSVGFSLFMRTPSLGNSFLLFYATGYLPFNLYQAVSNVVARAISFSKPLLKYPAVTWVDAVAARFILNSLTGILITFILSSGILFVTGIQGTLDMGMIILALALSMLLALGVGVLNCLLTGLFPIWELVWSIATRPLFLASGIFFLFDTMPEAAKNILWYNPLIHIVGFMRAGFFGTYSADYASVLYVVTVSSISLFFGMLLMRRNHRRILNS